MITFLEKIRLEKSSKIKHSLLIYFHEKMKENQIFLNQISKNYLDQINNVISNKNWNRNRPKIA